MTKTTISAGEAMARKTIRLNYVIYHVETDSYMSNKVTKRFSKHFKLAVLFKSLSIAHDNIAKSQLTDAVVLPVTVTLDPKDIFNSKLSGRGIAKKEK